MYPGRSLKYLDAGGVFQEVEIDTYLPAPIAFLLCDPGVQGTVIDMAGLPQIISQVPYYLKARNHQNPVNKDDSPFMYAYNTRLHYFKWIEQSGMEERHKPFGKRKSSPYVRLFQQILCGRAMQMLEPTIRAHCYYSSMRD